jgi:hypothetical protein
VKRDPRTGMGSAENAPDYWTLLPEAPHQVTIVMSDRGISKTCRHMHGFGSHTYSFINAQAERFWVKFHLRTEQGIQNLIDAGAAASAVREHGASDRRRLATHRRTAHRQLHSGRSGLRSGRARRHRPSGQDVSRAVRHVSKGGFYDVWPEMASR